MFTFRLIQEVSTKCSSGVPRVSRMASLDSCSNSPPCLPPEQQSRQPQGSLPPSPQGSPSPEATQRSSSSPASPRPRTRGRENSNAHSPPLQVPSSTSIRESGKQHGNGHQPDSNGQRTQHRPDKFIDNIEHRQVSREIETRVLVTAQPVAAVYTVRNLPEEVPQRTNPRRYLANECHLRQFPYY